MIRQLEKIDDNLLKKLNSDHYSRRVKSNYEAYGGKYDFCRFFELSVQGMSLLLISIFNSTMVVSNVTDVEYSRELQDDLTMLIEMTKPQTIEMNVTLANLLKPTLDNYTSCERTEFDFVTKNHLPDMIINDCPKLDDVFDVLKTSFPAVAKSYDLWLTDTSHKVRRGLSQCFMLENYTTATIQYICDNTVLVGQVATLPEERGRFHARKLLYWLGEKLCNEGYTVRLFARSNRVSYYEEIGFKAISKDIVFELKD